MRVYLCIVTLIISSSCSKFFESNSPSEYTPRDANSLNELLLGNAYLDPNNSAAAIFSLNEIFSDDWAISSSKGSSFENQSIYARLKPLYAWHPAMFELVLDNNTFGTNVWPDIYKHIMGCNAVLDYVDKVTGTTNEINYATGQALALRAFYYFQLVNLFGQPYWYDKNALAIPLQLSSIFDVDYPTQKSVEEVYNQIEADLISAEACYKKLPIDMQFVKSGRVTLPMIQLFSARVALFKEDYQRAIDYSYTLINDWEIKLLDLNNLQIPSEPVYQYYNFASYDNPESVWLFGNYVDFQRFVYTPIYMGSTQLRMFSPSSQLIDSYSNNDLRKYHYILKASQDKDNYVPSGKINVRNLVAVSGEFARSLRISEAYLMLAEAYVHMNEMDKATTVLEELRRKRFSTDAKDEYKVPVNIVSKDDLLLFVKDERRREMCFEGLRWFDQRRYGMESFTRKWQEEGLEMIFVMVKNDPAFTLPIPKNVMNRNRNLQQNKLSSPKY